MFLITPMVLLLIALAGGGAVVATQDAEDDLKADEIVEVTGAEQAPESSSVLDEPEQKPEP